jgi:cation-transporting P-type ATPase F
LAEIRQSSLDDNMWHNLTVERVSTILDVNIPYGLVTEQVEQRQGQFGLNKITVKKSIHPIVMFWAQLRQPLILILLAAGLITAIMEEWVDSAVIFGVAIGNSIVGFIQESKATRAIEALSKMLTTEATVLRSGQKKRIAALELVPGDIVILRSGDKVPADIRLCETKDLRIDESALTGESISVEKDKVEPVKENSIISDRKNMAFLGTLVTYGHGMGIVVSIGDMTQAGSISQGITTAQDIITPLTRKLARFSRILLYIVLTLAVLSFVVSIVRGIHDIETAFMSSIALAVAAIPEGLPAAMTITLAIGVSVMAKKHVIIRKLPAVEALGSTTIICSDKTGTLTQNQMTVTTIYCGGIKYSISGSGYSPHGDITIKHNVKEISNISISSFKHDRLKECLISGILCNDSQLVHKEGNDIWEAKGDPTEVALIVSGLKGGLDEDDINNTFPRIDTLPFESHLQYMATLHKVSDGIDFPFHILYVKGAVEKILSICSSCIKTSTKEIDKYVLQDKHYGNNITTGDKYTFNKKDDSLITGLTDGGCPLLNGDAYEIMKAHEEMASDGLRVLGFARKLVSPQKDKIVANDIDTNFVFIGLQAMLDPPRIEAISAVQSCQNAGIKVKMITGDNLHTAISIAKQLGLIRNFQDTNNNHPITLSKADKGISTAITGYDIAKFSEKELENIVKNTNVFARVSPDQKLSLVKAIQKGGEIVAVTGDGVNDAPALKQADIGIAMGVTGTDVAKEAADMVLTDDNFASIESAVQEGRGIFDNITKFLTWTLPTNFGEAMVILVSTLIGASLPILPVQILWINMTTALVLGMMLIFEPKEDDIMQRPPRNPKSSILSNHSIMRIFIVSGIIMLSVFAMFEWNQQKSGSTLEESMTVAVNTIVMIEIVYLLNCRSLTESLVRIGFFSNKYILLGIIVMVSLQMAFTYLPEMNSLFKSAPIGLEAWIMIISISIVSFFIIEIEKWIRRKRNSCLKPISRSEEYI